MTSDVSRAMRGLCVVLFLLTACSSAPAPVASNSPATATTSRISYPGTSSTQSPGRYAVLQRAGGGLDLISLARGNVVGSVAAQAPAFVANTGMPWTSTSLSRLYYLAGSQVFFLMPDGSGGPATTIAVGDAQEAGFSVSPDDTRIAVSIFTFATATPGAAYGGMRMYVEDLAGGGHHVDLFTSSTVAEYPVGWTGGHLVVAVSAPFCCAAAPVNPYAADSYHVVDAATGRRLATICTAAAPPQGPVEPAGTLCGRFQFVHWDGTQAPPLVAPPDAGRYHIALSPDGTQALVGGAPVRVLGGGFNESLGLNGDADGWADGNHVLVTDAATGFVYLLSPRGGGIQVAGDTAYIGPVPVAIS